MTDAVAAAKLDTLVLVSRLMEPRSAERYLWQRGVSVSVRAFDGMTANASVVLSAHEYDPGALLDISAQLRDCWVHLVSAGTEYTGLPGLCRENLLTRSWQAYSRPLTEYVLAALLDVAWKQRYHWHGESRPQASDERGLFGRSALVFGFGAIGRNIARSLDALGVRVSVVHRQGAEFPADGLAHLTLADISTTYDYFILALPDVPGTHGLVDEKVLSYLKPQGHLINVGRGNTVQMPALCRALEERAIWATLDVTDPEPLPLSHPLRGYPRARVSDHVAWQSGLSEYCFLDDWLALRALILAGRPLPDTAVVNRRFGN